MEPFVETRVFWDKCLHDVRHVGPHSSTRGLPFHYSDGAYQVCPPDADTFALRPGKLAIVRHEELTYTLRLVSAPQKIDAPWVVDFEFINIIAIVFFLMLTGITALLLSPSDIEPFDELTLNSSAKFAPLLEKQMHNTPTAKGPTAPAVKRGRSMQGKTLAAAPAAVGGGVLDALKRGTFKELLGDGAFTNVLAELGEVNNAPTAARDGLVARPGGFTTDGGLTTLRLAPGRPREAHYGEDVGKLTPRKDRDVLLLAEKPITSGALAPELIAQVIRDNRNMFRYCYERQLQVEKDLQGMVKLMFVISPTGTVASAIVKDATLKNAAVQECLVSRMRSLTFPKPLGGGIVVVNYPFVFRSN